MEKLIICIYDKVACVYNLFGDFANKGVVLRTISDLLKDKNFMCSSHPSDYDIVCVGKINTSTGFIDVINETYANCNDLVMKEGE